jgi:hypothetical protein
MDARRNEPFEARRYPLFERVAARHEEKRQVGRILPRVRPATELAECCCPDECLVDHDN